VFAELQKPLAQRNPNYDLNGDGLVTSADLGVIKSNYLTVANAPAPAAPAMQSTASAGIATSQVAPVAPAPQTVAPTANPLMQPVLAEGPASQLIIPPASNLASSADQPAVSTANDQTSPLAVRQPFLTWLAFPAHDLAEWHAAPFDSMNATPLAAPDDSVSSGQPAVCEGDFVPGIPGGAPASTSDLTTKFDLHWLGLAWMQPTTSESDDNETE
jgi:hypothetical protein